MPKPKVKTYKLSAKPRARKNKPRKMRTPRVGSVFFLIIALTCVAIAGHKAYIEMKTSVLQSQIFSKIAGEIKFEMGAKQNPDFYTPSFGPYNQRLGYSYMPFFAKALSAESYQISAQMRASSRYQQLVSMGLYPVYRAKTTAGFSLFDRKNALLYDASYPSHVFADFNSIPKPVVDTLLYIENRELLKPGPVTRNPVVEWDRLFYAIIGRLLHGVAPGLNVGGGSTLATQIEKFRFSPGGQTTGVKDKLRQIMSASIQAYMDGPDTRAMREHIVLDYLNSTPLSARQSFGEVNSLGDGLWAWFGRDLNESSAALNLPESDVESLQAKGKAYREVLGLILAQRRPTYYLVTDRDALDELTNSMLDKLAKDKVISTQLRDAAKSASFAFLPAPPPIAQPPYLEQKAANAMRNHLLYMLGLKNLYELDRIDLSVVSTLDQETQKKVTDFLGKMDNKDFIQSIGLYGFRLLKPENDLSKIKWSVVLYEKCDDGNRLRIQADNIDGPFDMNEGVKLDLGSTAKLRTLITYLEIVEELHRRYAGLSEEDLQDIIDEAPDTLTSWATTWLIDHPNASLEEILEAAMDRKYSGSPHETFFTGGGAHVFANFEREEDYRIMDVREAMRHSVNLVFIRIMRDIVNYTIAQGAQTKQELIGDPDHPARKEYLERYADKEGSIFLNRFISDYSKLSSDEALAKATGRAHKGATSRTIVFRSVRPRAGYEEYASYMNKNMQTRLDEARLKKLFRDYPVDRYSLADRAYISGIHPLELWLVAYLQANPDAKRTAILAVSKQIRLDSYSWLLRPSKKGAQDTRIRILLEADAFTKIHQRWSRLGYPFEKLVPSYATAIGSSADRPGALAELAGILLNDGVKQPTIRFEKLHFAEGTPYETIMEPGGKEGVQVLNPAIARVVKRAMADVVENGTARRLHGAYVDAAGKPFIVGGKTGTGDHRFDEFGPGGRLISSRVVNRTGTLVFFIGDRWFGTVTAHVAGEEAEKYKFTSALSAQMLKSLSPTLLPLINDAVSAVNNPANSTANINK